MARAPALLALLAALCLSASGLSSAPAGRPSGRKAAPGKAAWKASPEESTSGADFWSPGSGEGRHHAATVNLSSATEGSLSEAELAAQDRQWKTLVDNCIPKQKDVCLKILPPGKAAPKPCMVDIVDGCFGAPFPVRFTEKGGENLVVQEAKEAEGCLYHYSVERKRITVGGQRRYMGKAVLHTNGMRILIPGAREDGKMGRGNEFSCQVFIAPTGALPTASSKSGSESMAEVIQDMKKEELGSSPKEMAAGDIQDKEEEEEPAPNNAPEQSPQRRQLSSTEVDKQSKNSDEALKRRV